MNLDLYVFKFFRGHRSNQMSAAREGSVDRRCSRRLEFGVLNEGLVQ